MTGIRYPPSHPRGGPAEGGQEPPPGRRRRRSGNCPACRESIRRLARFYEIWLLNPHPLWVRKPGTRVGTRPS